ncbi:GntR family transcriptional regulator [Streptomyces sp. NPDC047043]|uniref:GntR family transcriptional regulator n=1 Tax=Streptomyces sp. NPDC047043 TaxID=3154497 RepID=UPI0033F14418
MSWSRDTPRPDLAARIGRPSALLRTQVLDVLRDAILTLEFPPGRRLVERELIDLTGVSRTTVREVLRELAAEGLVRTVPQKGAVVAELSDEETEEFYDLRHVLERHMIDRFVERASDGQVIQLRRTLTRFEALVDAGCQTRMVTELLSAQASLYDVLLAGAGNTTLRSSLTQLHARGVRLRAVALLTASEQPDGAARGLRRLVEAIEDRDAPAAREAVAALLAAEATAAASTGARDLDDRAGETARPAEPLDRATRVGTDRVRRTRSA